MLGRIPQLLESFEQLHMSFDISFHRLLLALGIKLILYVCILLSSFHQQQHSNMNND